MSELLIMSYTSPFSNKVHEKMNLNPSDPVSNKTNPDRQTSTPVGDLLRALTNGETQVSSKRSDRTSARG